MFQKFSKTFRLNFGKFYENFDKYLTKLSGNIKKLKDFKKF